MILKILTIYIFFMSTGFDARYSEYHKPVWQDSKVPFFGTYEPIAVEPFSDEEFTRLEDHAHILNMSIDIIKDVYVKERHMKLIQRVYRADIKYTLGVMIAGTIEKFGQMARIFRYYAQPSIYDVNSANETLHTHATISMIQAYQVMQGEYNELRIESELYFDFIGNKEKMLAQIEEASGAGTMKPPTLEELEKIVDVDEFNKMNEKAQLEKIEEMKNIYSSGGISRRRRAGGSAQVRRSKLLFAPDAAQEEYKRSIRYQSWAKKWNGFNPKTEGIEISKPLAKLGRNMSRFLNVNPF